MKKYIVIGWYYGLDVKIHVEIKKFKNKEEALELSENKFPDPIIMELVEFDKLYKKARKGSGNK